MTDIDEMFESIDRARLKLLVLIFLPFFLWYTCFLYLWIISLWELWGAFLYPSPIIIILYPLFHFKGMFHLAYFLSDEERKFLENWKAFKKSKSPNLPNIQEEFNEFHEENK